LSEQIDMSESDANELEAKRVFLTAAIPSLPWIARI
jgi:hypothetical protein